MKNERVETAHLTQDLDRLASKLSEKLPSTADVSIANPDDLKMKVFSVDKLYAYDKFRDDVAVYQNLCWMMLGAVLGTLSGVVTEGIWDWSHLIFKIVIVQILFLSFCLYMWRRAGKSSKEARTRLGL